MVLNEHQIGRTESGVDAAGSIGDDQGSNPQQLHHTHRQGHLLEVIALIIVEASLHAENFPSFQLSHHKLSLVSGDSGYREVRDVPIGNLYRIGQLFGKVSQALNPV